jgi:hypothetical protein
MDNLPDETEKRVCLAIPPEKCDAIHHSGRRGLAQVRSSQVKPKMNL